MSILLITGCAGFIGARTVELALDSGHEVVGIDNLNDYYDPRLKALRLARFRERKGFLFLEGDIESKEFVNELFSRWKFDAVVHLAARAGVRYSQQVPDAYLKTNALGFLHVLEAMRLHDVKKVVLASTSSLYAGEPRPFSETSAVNRPISPYAASKKAAEMYAYTYHFLYGLDVSVCRYFTVYGPAGRPDMAPFRFIKWTLEGTPITIFGDGNQSRDFTFVDDIARGTLCALRPLGYEVINLGGGKQPTTINEVIRTIERLSGRKAVLRFASGEKTDMQDTQADIAKARELLDWEPEIGLEEGLSHCVKWHMENEDWIRSIDVK